VRHFGKACENCAAWEPLKPTRVGPVPVGRCRSLPPSSTTHWPVTSPSDWCMRFEPELRERATLATAGREES
jgi:hypothetical protein